MEKSREIDEFAYMAAHDLQEPLRKITSFSERLKEKLPDNLEPEIKFYLTRMLAATDNMRRLIDNLLEFSRTSRVSEPFTKTDLNDIVAQVKSELELKIEETSTEIIADKLPVLDAIPTQMHQLFANLFTNAIKFKKADSTPRIHITCRVLDDEEKKAYEVNVEGTVYEIVIRDEGIGFEQEFASRIFQIFQRLHGKAEYPGSGIGLAICKKIAENHNGQIFARSEAGKGASFFLIIPELQTK
jgi:light-regulated signal transduction histidine kinase (bacteriophytochrome)